MDRDKDKNYNVDDILSEIKRKKMERKTSENPQSSNETGQRAKDLYQKSPYSQASRTPAQREEFNINVEKPRNRKAEEAGADFSATPKREAEHNFTLDTEALKRKWDDSPAREESRPDKDERAPKKEAAPDTRTNVGRGGFNFSYDDAERRERSQPRAEYDDGYSNAENDQPARRNRTGTEEKQPEKSEYFDYTGHVRPLTEKAKIRNRYDKIAQERSSRSRLQEENERGDASALEDMIGATQEHKIPKHGHRLGLTSTGRELRLEDIRNMDFSALAEERMSGDYYDDDDDYYDSESLGKRIADLGEYNSTADRRDVANDIAKTKLWLFIRAAATAVLTVILFWYALSGKYAFIPLPKMFFPEPETMRNYLIFSTAIAALIAVVNSSTVGNSVINLFKMRANSDTLATFAVFSAIGQGVAGIVNPQIIQPEKLNLYFPIAALAMLFNSLSKIGTIGRIQQNFRVISSNSKKEALLTVDSEHMCYDIIREPARRRPTIAYGVRAGFFTDFLALSFSDKYDVGINRSVAPVCIIAAVVVSVSTYFLTKSMYAAMSALAAILCICATLSAAFIESIPLAKLAKKLAPRGVVVSGNKSVEDFCDTKAVILKDKDLFPRGHISLHGIKAFSQGRIDDAILDAASVLCALDGALAPMFLDMIGGNKKLLRKVDSIVYENGMGVSAWVEQKRVLIGNRQLMQNHGVTLPADRYEQGVVSAKGSPLYLSNSGEVSARFLIDYIIDEELAAELDHLAAHNTKVVVYTSDANITPHKVWEIYGYPENLVQILSSEFHETYRDMSAPQETAVAELVYTNKPSGMLAGITACVNARSSILYATIIQMIQIVLGYGIVVFMSFMGFIGSLNIVQILLYQTFWFIAIFVIQQTRQS